MSLPPAAPFTLPLFSSLALPPSLPPSISLSPSVPPFPPPSDLSLSLFPGLSAIHAHVCEGCLASVNLNLCEQIESNLWSLFNEMDEDGSGQIDVDELRRC
jgi:hypothetical protein